MHLVVHVHLIRQTLRQGDRGAQHQPAMAASVLGGDGRAARPARATSVRFAHSLRAMDLHDGPRRLAARRGRPPWETLGSWPLEYGGYWRTETKMAREEVKRGMDSSGPPVGVMAPILSEPSSSISVRAGASDANRAADKSAASMRGASMRDVTRAGRDSGTCEHPRAGRLPEARVRVRAIGGCMVWCAVAASTVRRAGGGWSVVARRGRDGMRWRARLAQRARGRSGLGWRCTRRDGARVG